MAPPLQISHITLCLIFSLLLPTHTTPLNITQILSHYPDLSDFTTLLTTTGILPDLTHRTSLTILAVPNTFLRSSPSFPPSSRTTLADVVRYHILLQYLSLPDLRRTQPAGTSITTLLQTTGRVPTNLGSLNVTHNPSTGVISFHPPNNSSVSSHILSLLTTIPYNLSIFTVDSLLFPYGYDLMASETRPPPPGLNITRALIDGHDFHVAASMLFASGVISEFEQDEGGAGITLFVPTDFAFANLLSPLPLQALPADKKGLVLKFHVLHSYYPLGSLQSIVNPVQPTLATEDNGAGSFTLNISRVNGSVEINTGVIQAVVTQTVFDQNPVAIFGVSNVLLPKEIFGEGGGLRGGMGSGPYIGAQAPVSGPGPESSYGDPRLLSSPLGATSEGRRGRKGRWVVVVVYSMIVCIFLI